MAHQASSSSPSHQVENPTIEYSEHCLWDYQYEAPSFANETPDLPPLTIGQEFDAVWDFEDGAEGLHIIADVAAAEIVTEDIPEHKPSKRLWNFGMISKYFHLPMNQAAKKLDLKETALRKICNKMGIGRWPYRKLLSLERQARNARENPDNTEMINELDMQREHILKDPTVKSGVEIDRLRVSHSKKRKYRSLTELSFSAPLRSLSVVSAVPLPQTEEEEVSPSLYLISSE